MATAAGGSLNFVLGWILPFLVLKLSRYQPNREPSPLDDRSGSKWKAICFYSRQIKPALIQDQRCHFADDGSPFAFAQFLFSTGREMSVEVSAQGVDHGSRSHEFQSRNNPSSFFLPIEIFFHNRIKRNCKDRPNPEAFHKAQLNFWAPDPLKLLRMVGLIFYLGRFKPVFKL